MKAITCLLFLISFSSVAQLPLDESQFLSRLTPGGGFPENLLSTKSVVFYSPTLTEKELSQFQKGFARCGIDAVVYYESDYVTAGRDVVVKLAGVLNKREISNLIYLQKENVYKIIITPYNQKANFVELNQPALVMEHRALDVLLQNLYNSSANSLKNENLLINDVPETGFSVRVIDGNRNEFYAIDLKVDPLAVPKFGDEEKDKALEELMNLFPYKYTLTDANLSESELRKQGYLYVLRFIHARNKTARNVLGYDLPKGQSAIVSLAFINDTQQIKNIPINEVVYKYYFKHIQSGNVFLGTKWDSDQSWQQALFNQLKGFRTEFKIP